MTSLVEVSTSNAYPANVLRLAFTGECLKRETGSSPDSSIAELIPADNQLRGLNRTATQLLTELRERVLPVIAESILNSDPDYPDWPQEQQAVRELATKVAKQETVTRPDKIAFVAATNWQLCDNLAAAFKARNQAPWKELYIFLPATKY